MKNYNIEEIKKFLKKYEDARYQIYNSRNIAGDEMELIYDKDDVFILEATYWEYLEIFGLTEEDYDSLWEGMHKIHIH